MRTLRFTLLGVAIAVFAQSALGVPPPPAPPPAAPPPAAPPPKPAAKPDPVPPKPAVKKVDPPPKPAAKPETKSKPKKPADPEPPPEAPPPPPTPPPVVIDATCAPGVAQKLVRELDDWVKMYKDGEKRLAGDLRCQEPNVICLNRMGELLNDTLPAKVPAGERLSAYVLMPSIDTGRVSVSVSYRANTAVADGPFDGAAPPAKPAPAPAAAPPGSADSCVLLQSQRDAIRAVGLPIARLASRSGLESLGAPADAANERYWSSASDAKIIADWTAWLDAQKSQRALQFTSIGSRIDVPQGDQINVDFTRTERGARAPAIDRHYTLGIDNGRYYLELGLLVPFVFRGNRYIELVPNPGSDLLRLSQVEEWHISAAPVIQFFPFGRQRGQASSFANCRIKGCIDNSVGAQFGMGLSEPLKEWYLGLVMEPVSGLSANLGMAMLKGDFYAHGRAEGMLIPSPSESVVNREYMLRAYVGFTLTLDVLETMQRAAISARQLM